MAACGLCLFRALPQTIKAKKKKKNLKELGGFCKYCHQEIQLSLKLTPEEWLASYLDLVVLTRSSLTTVGA